MPKKVVPAKKPSRKHTWACPDCGQVILHTFDGEEHIIERGHGEITKCGGLFESVIFNCGNCGCDIEVAREELEKA